MKYWWVNQNQTYKAEVPGGFLWSPKTRADGARNQFYDNMKNVEPGDVVFSFCDTYIKAVGVATRKAVSAAKPDFGTAGGTWSNEGWLVEVEFRQFNSPIRPKNYIDVLRPHLPSKYSPLQANGDGLQSVYLAEVPLDMATAIIQLIGKEYPAALTALGARLTVDEEAPEIAQEKALLERTDIGATQKQQLVNARRGQGLFKANVRMHETNCRVTLVSDPTHLRASHIKPWRDSSDSEKIDGSNGLLLAPHIDHLFDRGYISFSDDGGLMVSPTLPLQITQAWHLLTDMNVGTFTNKQKTYLKYHRDNIFKSET